MDKIHNFYCRKPWRDISYRLKIERGGRCNRCGSIMDDMSMLIGHHMVELTEDNVDDPSISLNPDLVEIICLGCHNKEHRRFGYRKKVYVVWGSPLSGKTSLVRELMLVGDIVLDIDALWRAITLQPEYVKPPALRYNVFTLRDNLMDQIKTRHGQWCDAYIIGGYPDKYERQRLCETMGAEAIYCESTRDDCLARCKQRPAEWQGYVNSWWDVFGRSGR